MKKPAIMIRKGLVLAPILFVLCMTLVPTGVAASPTLQTIYVDPPSIDGTGRVGESVTVNISIANGVNVWAWQAGLVWNPDVLECTGRQVPTDNLFAGKTAIGPFYGSIDNFEGFLTYTGYSLASPEVTGANGSGVLMEVTFQVVGEGISDLHLANVKTNKFVPPGSILVSECAVADVYTADVGGINYVVDIVHNSTGSLSRAAGGPLGIANPYHIHQVDPPKYVLGFDLTGLAGKTSFCNVTIPMDMINDDDRQSQAWNITVGGIQYFNYTEIEHGEYTSLYLEVTTTTVAIDMEGWIPEFPTMLLTVLMLIAISTAIIIGKKIVSTKHAFLS